MHLHLHSCVWSHLDTACMLIPGKMQSKTKPRALNWSLKEYKFMRVVPESIVTVEDFFMACNKRKRKKYQERTAIQVPSSLHFVSFSVTGWRQHVCADNNVNNRLKKRHLGGLLKVFLSIMSISQHRDRHHRKLFKSSKWFHPLNILPIQEWSLFVESDNIWRFQ